MPKTKLADEFLDPGCFMRVRAEDGLCVGHCPGCDRERYLRALRRRVFQSELGKAARSILRQYNENQYPSYRFHGPHYVSAYEGQIYLRPYGEGSAWRYSFHVIPDYDFGRLEEPFYIFNVL